MKLDEIKKQLGSKLRTTNDLIRFIKTRTDANPNYTLLFGAGCSVTSGVRPATALCDIWRSEILTEENAPKDITEIESQRDWLKKYKSDWYDPQREYSTLFEKNMIYNGNDECLLKMKCVTPYLR